MIFALYSENPVLYMVFTQHAPLSYLQVVHRILDTLTSPVENNCSLLISLNQEYLYIFYVSVTLIDWGMFLIPGTLRFSNRLPRKRSLDACSSVWMPNRNAARPTSVKNIFGDLITRFRTFSKNGGSSNTK